MHMIIPVLESNTHIAMKARFQRKYLMLFTSRLQLGAPRGSTVTVLPICYCMYSVAIGST